MVTIIAQTGDFKIEKIANSFYVVDNNGDVWHRSESEKKARFQLNKILKSSGQAIA